MKPAKATPYLALALGVLVVSTAAIIIRFAQKDAPSAVIAAWRLSTASILMAPWVLARHSRDLKKMGRREWIVVLVSGLMLSIHFTTWIESLEHTSVASSVLFVTTNPLWVALAAPFTVGDPWRRDTMIGLALAMAGGLVIGLGDAQGGLAGSVWGDFLALIGAMAGAAYLLFGRYRRDYMPLWLYLWLVYSTAAVLLVTFALITGHTLIGYPTETIMWMVLLALGPQMTGHSSLNYALGHLSATYVSLTILGEPVGSTILAALLLGEMPGTAHIIGGALVLAGISVASREEMASSNAEAP